MRLGWDFHFIALDRSFLMNILLCLSLRLIVCLLSQNPYKILFFLLCDNIIHDKYFVYN